MYRDGSLDVGIYGKRARAYYVFPASMLFYSDITEDFMLSGLIEEYEVLYVSSKLFFHLR